MATLDKIEMLRKAGYYFLFPPTASSNPPTFNFMNRVFNCRTAAECVDEAMAHYEASKPRPKPVRIGGEFHKPYIENTNVCRVRVMTGDVTIAVMKPTEAEAIEAWNSIVMEVKP